MIKKAVGLLGRELLAEIVKFYVRYTATHPELSRLMTHEARQDTWRIHYLTEKHIKPSSDALRKPVMDTLEIDEQAFIHWYYIMVSANATIFSFAPEGELLFGIDSRQAGVVDAHAQMLVNMLL